MVLFDLGCWDLKLGGVLLQEKTRTAMFEVHHFETSPFEVNVGPGLIRGPGPNGFYAMGSDRLHQRIICQNPFGVNRTDLKKLWWINRSRCRVLRHGRSFIVATGGHHTHTHGLDLCNHPFGRFQLKKRSQMDRSQDPQMAIIAFPSSKRLNAPL